MLKRDKNWRKKELNRPIAYHYQAAEAQALSQLLIKHVRCIWATMSEINRSKLFDWLIEWILVRAFIELSWAYFSANI